MQYRLPSSSPQVFDTLLVLGILRIGFFALL